MSKKKVYIVMLLIALTIYVLQRLSIPVPSLINNYVNDFLCLPLLLGGMTFFIWRIKKDYLFEFSFIFVLFLACYYAVYFEYYLPKVNSRYTSDWIDVVLYFSGGVAFYFIQKRKNVLLSWLKYVWINTFTTINFLYL